MNTANTPAFVKVNSTSRFKALSQGMAIFVVGIGCLGFVGWLFDVAILKSLIPGWATMKSNTAVLFILSGILLWMQNRKNHARWITPIGTLIVLLVSTLTLGEYLFHVDIRIDQILFKDQSTNVLYPGRMSTVTAFSFFLISLSFLVLYLSYENRAVEYSVLSVFWISMLALIGYL